MTVFPCTCGGENANCMHCDGTGLSTKRPRTLREQSQTLRELSTRISKNGADPGMAVPDGLSPIQKQRRMLLDRTAELTKASHTPERLPKPAKLPSARISTNTSGRCPICKKQFKNMQGFRAHAQSKHTAEAAMRNKSERPQEEPALSKPRSPKSSPKDVAVQYLPRQVRTPSNTTMGKKGPRKTSESTTQLEPKGNRLGSRKSLSGPLQSALEKYRQTSRPAKKEETSAEESTVKSHVPGTAPRGGNEKLDAKYGWGGTFRDNGEFGSYPSHDSMDDESNA